MRYARLYNGTVATDYYRAMAAAERRLALSGNADGLELQIKQLLALVESLDIEGLGNSQKETIRALLEYLSALAYTA